MRIQNRKIYIMQRIQKLFAAQTADRYLVVELDDEAACNRMLGQWASAYETEVSHQVKYKRRQRGIAAATAYAYQRPATLKGKKPFWVILLVSKGMGLVEREPLISLGAKKNRIELDGYELVHDGVSWSWKMTKGLESYWQDRIRRVCAAKPEKRNMKTAQALVDNIAQSPGFRLVRRQIGHLLSLYKSEWQRLRPETEPRPTFPTFLPYVTQLSKKPKPPRHPTPEG